MKRSTLVLVSAIRDALDFMVVGQAPFLNVLLSLPVWYLHYRFAGPQALFTLFECVPLIETFPGFTAMAMSYPDPKIEGKNLPADGKE
ncbi:MAG: hypothetical protein QM754_08030 [Tepidisphaeraceae bacterium]